MPWGRTSVLAAVGPVGASDTVAQGSCFKAQQIKPSTFKEVIKNISYTVTC